MRIRSLAAAAALALGLVTAGSAAAQQSAAPVADLEAEAIEISPLVVHSGGTTQVITLPFGKARIVRLPADVRDVLVANPETADVVMKTPQLAYLIGRAVGVTNAFFFDGQQREVARVEISVQIDALSVTEALRDLMPEADVEVKTVNQNLFLTGRVRSAQMAENARQIAIRFVEAEDNVVNLLSIIEDQQVLLQVRVAEVSRSIMKELGVNLLDTVLGNTSGVASGVPPNSVTTFTSNDLRLDAISSSRFIVDTPFFRSRLQLNPGGGDILTLVINALERNGLIKTLAEPNLTAVSGENADFLVGGEFPIPVEGDQLGNVTKVEFKPFGVGLNFTPVVLSSGRISLRIATEVSALSDEGAITFGQITIPALSVRRANTTVELPSGGSLIIAGLIRDDLRTSIDGVPGAKDVPILGALFRSNALQKTETELVVAVTCYLVRPVNRNQIKLPQDNIAAPSDVDLYFLGRLHAVYDAQSEPPSRTALQGPLGYIIQ